MNAVVQQTPLHRFIVDHHLLLVHFVQSARLAVSHPCKRLSEETKGGLGVSLIWGQFAGPFVASQCPLVAPTTLSTILSNT